VISLDERSRQSASRFLQIEFPGHKQGIPRPRGNSDEVQDRGTVIHIVEALQFRKAMVRSELLFRELPSTILDEELEIFNEDNDPEWVDEEDPSSWDRFSTDIDSDVDD
jgi:hypothetical protein